MPEAERVRRERARELAAGIVAYSADADCRTVVFALDGRLWVLRVGDDPREPAGVPEPVPAAGAVTDPRIDPTGQRVAYVADGALHVTELADGTGRLLAAPEHDDVSYGLAEHVAAESMLRFRGYWWAPDGQRLLAARVDNSAVQRWWITDPADPERPPRAVRYPAAGTANADVTLHVLRLDGSRTEVTWDRGAYEYLAAAEWDSRGPLLSVQSRDQRTVMVLAADAVTGQTTLLHTERDDAWVELAPGTPARTSAGDLVTVSDRDGSRRLVVGGAAVTPDGLHVGSVSGTDGEAVYFTATDERDPTERHLWRYDPGQGLSRCSADPGVHDGEAAGGTVVVLSRTEAGSAAAVAWRDGTRAAIASLEAEPLLKPRITWLTLGARELRAALLLPSWYRPGTRLPVLLSPYGGPAMQRVVRARGAAFCEDQWFAEQGFAVLVTDGRGTPGRGPEWSKTVFGDTLSAPLEDQVDALDAVCRSVPRPGPGAGRDPRLVLRRGARGHRRDPPPRRVPRGRFRGRAARSAALRHALAGAVPRPAAAEPGRIRPVLHHDRGRQPDQAAAADSRDGRRQRGGGAHAPDVGGAARGRPPAPGPAAVRRHPHARPTPSASCCGTSSRSSPSRSASPGLTQTYCDNAPLRISGRAFVNGLAVLADDLTLAGIGTVR